MREREARPVYIVPRPAPARRNWFGFLVIAAVVVLVAGGALQQARPPAPTATAGLFVPDVTPAPTPNARAVADAVQAALDRQRDRMDAKLSECDDVIDNAAAYAKCGRQYQALDAQWTALDDCAADAATVAAVAGCERKVGIH